MKPAEILEEIYKCAGLLVIVACAMLILFTLTACGGRTITHDRPVKVLVPVAQSCALPRPTPPAPLSARSDWETLDVKQKKRTGSQTGARTAHGLRTAQCCDGGVPMIRTIHWVFPRGRKNLEQADYAPSRILTPYATTDISLNSVRSRRNPPFVPPNAVEMPVFEFA
jgi:hypothetical protein